METEIPNKESRILWFSREAVSNRPQQRGCVRLPQILLAWPILLA
jgi:hypothetical protein